MPLNLVGPIVCQWIGAESALEHFAKYAGVTQSQQHIKPLHCYVACRLVVEGGFLPEDITPHPPFIWKRKGLRDFLLFDPSVATGAESTVLGGLKTKNVDVVVAKPAIGPVMAVSVKGTIGAFRNLTNRMEEAVGDCTNLHITYPAMVAGYVSVLRANQEQEKATEAVELEGAPPARQLTANDIAIRKGGAPIETIIRYHTALRELTGRRGIRDDVSRYEAVALALVESNTAAPGAVLDNFPPQDSPLRFEQFFQALYLRYDERYVYAAPDLKGVTRRREWAENSPIFADLEHIFVGKVLDYEPRIAAEP